MGRAGKGLVRPQVRESIRRKGTERAKGTETNLKTTQRSAFNPLRDQRKRLEPLFFSRLIKKKVHTDRWESEKEITEMTEEKDPLTGNSESSLHVNELEEPIKLLKLPNISLETTKQTRFLV